MKYAVACAVLLFLLGVVVAVWLLPDPRDWGDLPPKSRLPVAALIIGVLALAATLLAILAAVLEVRHVFPKQAVRVSTTRRVFVGVERRANQMGYPLTFKNENHDTYQLIFENRRNSPIINTFRIYVRLVNIAETRIGGRLFLTPNLASALHEDDFSRCRRTETTLDSDLPIVDETVAIDIPGVREAPYPGTWMRLAETFRPPIGTNSMEWVSKVTRGSRGFLSKVQKSLS